MQVNRLLLALTIANSVALAAIAAGSRPAQADGVPAVLRGRSLEIVDQEGRVRASIAVLPADASRKGERETVLLRLITEKGRPSVKIGTSEESAGISLAGPTGTSDTYVILESRGTTSSLKLRNEDERERVVTP